MPTGGLQIINDKDPSGPLRDVLSASPGSDKPDLNTAGALCLRDELKAAAVQRGIGEVQRSAALRGRPAIIVHGRDDGLIPVNHSSRPYLGLNGKVEGGRSRLSYIEVLHAQHLDSLLANGTAGFDARYVPLMYYFYQALDQLYAALAKGSPLPQSQVVRPTVRGGVAGSGGAAGTSAE